MTLKTLLQSFRSSANRLGAWGPAKRSHRRRRSHLPVKTQVELLDERILLAAAFSSETDQSQVAAAFLAAALDGTTPAPITGEIRLNDQTRGLQQTGRISTSVAPLANGTFIATWQSIPQDGSGWGIYAQTFDPSGILDSPDFKANTTTKWSQKNSVVASTADGRFVIVWQGSGRHVTEIFAQRFSAEGLPVGGEILVNSTTRGIQWLTSVAMSADGSFVVAWQGNGAGDRHGIFARRFSADGIAVTGELRVAETSKRLQMTPAIASDSTGKFAVAWFGRGTGDLRGVFVRSFDANGQPLSQNTTVPYS